MSDRGGHFVVIGLGNEDRLDDACGRWVARRLRHRTSARVEESEGDATTLLDLWEGANVAFLADALVSGAAPGTVRRLEHNADVQGSAPESPSTHGLGLRQALGLGSALGRAPARCVIYGIEAGALGPGRGLSAAVDAAVDCVVADLLSELRALGVPDHPAAQGRIAHA